MPYIDFGKMAGYYSFDHIDLIAPRPVLFIADSEADTKHYSDEAYAKAKEPKELFVIEGATHVALYDKPEFVSQAVQKLAAFFGEHL